MAHDRDAWIRQEIEEHTDDQGDLAPPWAQFPDYTRYTIGWRMGNGESWMMIWWAWLKTCPRDEAWRLDYLRRHGPAPRTWADVAAGVLVGDDAPKALRDPQRLLQLGVVGVDVAYGNWLRSLQGAPQAAWANIHGWNPRSFGRYSARELSFHGRWWSEQRDVGGLRTWLDEAPAPGPEWQAVVQTLRSGVLAEAHHDTDQGYRLLTLNLAAGAVPAPWTLGLSASTVEQEYNEDDGYADAWLMWTDEAFDDDATWQAWLNNQPPAPADWKDLLKENVQLD